MTSLDRHVMMVQRPPQLAEEVLNKRLKTVAEVYEFFKSFEAPAAGSRPIQPGVPRPVGNRIPPFKFVYCAKVDTGLDFRPYDIVVVHRGDQPREHYVVSPMAVVHVIPHSPSEVILIQHWLRESKQFDQMRKIRFFKQYLVAKFIGRWRSNVNYTKYLHARARLAKKFFLSKETFAQPTDELRSLTFDLRLTQMTRLAGKMTATNGKQNAQTSATHNVFLQGIYSIRLLHYPDARPTHGYTKDSFLDAQQQHFTKVAGILGKTMEAAKNIMMGVVEAVSERACVPDLATMEQLEQHLSICSNVKGKMGALYRMERDMERQDRKREMKRRMVEYDFLLPWVRLVDLMVSTELVHNVLDSFSVFARHLDLPKLGQHRDLRISFQVIVKFPDDNLQFYPNVDEVKALIEGFVDDTTEKVSAFLRPVEMKELKVHFHRQPDFLPIKEILLKDTQYQSTLASLMQIVERDFADAAEKSKVYDPCKYWLQFVHKEWPAEYATWEQRANERAKDKMLNEHDIRKYIAKVSKARADLQKMKNTNVGILSVNIDNLVTDLFGKLDHVLADIQKTLLTLAQKRLHEVWKELENSINLIKYPQSEDLRDFAEWVERCNNVDDHSKALLGECAEVNTLYCIAEDNLFDYPQAHKDNRAHVVGAGRGSELPLCTQFSDALNAAKAKRDQQLDDSRKLLDLEISNTVDVLVGIRDELRHGEATEASHAASSILGKLKGTGNALVSLRSKKDTLNHYCELLDVSTPGWEALANATETFEQKQDLWETIQRWEKKRSEWNTTPVSHPEMEGEKIKEEMIELYQKALKINKACPDKVTERLLNGIMVEKNHLPVMVELCNPALKEEHWQKIFDGIGKSLRLPPADKRTLETLRTFGAYEHIDLINSISANATGEYSLLNQVNKIALLWDKTEFVLVKSREAEGASMVLGGLDEVMLQLEDNQVQIQTCLASRYVGGIKLLVEEWDAKLQNIADVLDEWVNVQRSWMYLEFIFSSDDIKKQLPEESRMFNQVDKVFRQLMLDAFANNNVATICCQEGLLASLQLSTTNLDKIQKRLEDYLETKRIAFPRFYFLSNDELLSILSDVRNPTAVQPHLQKCFDAIKELDFESSHLIIAMKSQEGERVPFSEKIRVVGNVENWLNDIERMMRLTLYDIMASCFEAYKQTPRTQWYFQFPAQNVLCVDQIVWTNEMEQVWEDIKGGNSKALEEYLEFYKKQILSTVELVKGSLDKLQRTCVCTLIVMDVHNRDVTSSLLQEGCTESQDFNWVKQLRYYWTKEEDRVDCHIRHSAANVMYGYEYLGNQLRLVITPLTERAFLTCTSALHMNQGGAPQGPAGTGKTESVKDLGKGLARQVVVFNCSDGLNYKMMSRMFAGLAQAGAWACFDEFNRIEIEVLSVIAQQMLNITTAIANKQTSMVFDDHNIRLHKNFGVFITMNPGYAGRTELPDNLKALFRPICMMIPDYALIAEIMFFSEGFGDAKSLAQKMVRLYSLASQQLSKCDHYDFGMRAVKSILVMAGALKRAEPDQPEDMILIRAMRDSNVPKFLREDTKLFLALIKDLFPMVNIREVINEELQKEITATMERQGLQIVPKFIEKIVQLYDTMVVRHGVMLVGETMTGKTTNANILKDSLTHLHAIEIKAQHEADQRFYQTTLISTMNPKSISMGEMYGDVNKITREWQDGVLSHIIRDLVKLTGRERQWVCFDGPVDALWIENMNTVLDDNKMLCLVNGERIKLPDTISILFEVQDLRVASPATVSRCGMVFMEAYYLNGGWEPLAKSFSEKIVKEGGCANRWRHDRVITMLEKIIPPTLTFYRKNCQEYIKTVDAQLVKNLLTMLNSLLMNRDVDDDDDDVETAEKKTKVPKTMMDERKLFDMLFVFSYIWSMGSNVGDESREEFSKFAAKVLRETLHLPFPEDGSVYDYFVHKGSQTWVPWTYKVPSFQYDSALPYFDLLVPTTDTVVLKTLLGAATAVNKHVLVNGVTGTGKSVAVASFLSHTLQAESTDSHHMSFAMNFSAQTSSQNFQETMENKLHRRRGDKVLGPPVGKRLVVMVDDCNMPQLEQYGASPPIELLRQIISQGGCYDRKKLFWKDYVELMIVACCGEPGGGKNEMTMRLTSHFHCICIPAVSRTSMKTIFSGILSGYLAKNFDQKVKEISTNAVEATIDVYERIAAEMLPTPEKTHYTFNLRDVSKVIQGILQVKPNRMPSPEVLIRSWIHESSRVFHDRLINDNDRTWWWKCIEETMAKRFKGQPFDEGLKTVLYGTWADKKSTDYKELSDQKMLQEMLREYQLDYNATKMKDVDLVLFDDAIGHLARICRILRQPRGNALLVGVGGSGRHSLCELAAHICAMDCRGIVIVRNYGINEFHEDLRKILLDCGTQAKELVFLMSDTQIIYNQFLEDINNILNIGEIPGLMGAEEMDTIMNTVREAVRAAGKPETRQAVYQYFVTRCRENLHVIMCMSPVGSQFRERLRMFPSLVNCMTIDWFTPWPAEALRSVSQRVLSKMNLGSDHLRNAVCEMAVHMHESVKDQSEVMYQTMKRRNYTTPTSYLSLLSFYTEVYEEQDKLIADNMKRYKNGLDKLLSTNAMIQQLSKKISEMQPVLAKASKDADEQAAQLVIEQKEADTVKEEVSHEEAIAREFMDESTKIRAECQAGLDQALPALYAAEAALNTLSQRDISEVKTFTTPPTNVEKTMDAVLILLKEKDGWASAKKVLGQMDFLSRLRDYPKDEIPPALIRKLKKYADDKEFTPDIIEQTNIACKSLCMWVLAMNKYYHVSREIEPRRQQLKIAEEKFAKAQADLQVKQAKLDAIVKKIDRLQKEAQETADRKASLEDQIETATAKLGRADQLISGLADEKIRWEQLMEKLKVQKKNLVGTMILAAGCVAYIGPFVSTFRRSFVEDWTKHCKDLEIPCEDGFSLDTLPDQYTIREWALQSLPQDPFSIENGTILQRSKRWCLMIDPQGQANLYIRKKEAKNKLRVLKLTDDNFMRTIESAIQVGHPVLLENVGEELDASLNPVLLKQYVKQGGRYVLKLGDKEVDYDPLFRLYITTKLPNPTFSPELQIKVTVINFTVTRKGLEDQLLSDVVSTERADLQEKSDQCVVAIAEGKQKIKELEDAILKNLADSSGDILDNIELIETLKASKATSEAIAKDLEVVEKTNAEINETREKYRTLATRGSLIYGVIADFANADPMYQNSLQFFKKLVLTTLEKIDHVEGETVESRVKTLIPGVSWTSYSVVCRGLFEKHKLLFSFYLTMNILRFENFCSDAEWLFLLRGSGGRPPPETFSHCPNYLSDKVWSDFASLCDLKEFSLVEIDIVKTEAAAWKEWIHSDKLYELPMPGAARSFSEWYRLLLIRTFRPEKLIFAMARVVAKHLGQEYTESPQFSMKDAFLDSSCMAPLIFVLSAGTDPTVLFTTFAQEMGFEDKKSMLSLGQDQGKRAADMITEARKEGHWVYLQNCHVYVSWMPSLEKIVENMKPEDTHPDFRLWLTSNPSPYFPIPVLQTGMKLTREPPKGLKANLKDAIHTLDVELWEEQTVEGSGPSKERNWKTLIFALAFFHAIIQERRKFGALGWNIPYEWGAPDMAASVKTMRIGMTEFGDEIPWTALQYTVGVINYGGRVTDFLDNRCLQAIVMRFFKSDLMEEKKPFDASGVYHTLEPCSKEELMNYIEALPQYEQPELFGLHGNANITSQAKESNAVMATLIELQPRGGGGSAGGKTVDELVMETAAQLLERLPKKVDASKGHPSSFTVTEDGTMISLGTVLSQEIDQFNNLLRVIGKSLNELMRAIKGEVVMSVTMETMYTSFVVNLQPGNWQKAGYLCLKPLGSYFADLIKRVEFISSWCYNGAPASFWLPGFFFPQGFITGVFQTHSRKHKVPIDTLKFRFNPRTTNSTEGLPSVENGVYVHGFYLEGAGWNSENCHVCESKPGVLFTELPVIHLDPIPLKDPDPPNMYDCPMYKASTRAGVLSTTGLSTNFVLTMQLSCGKDGDSLHWINRGVAALCMLDD